MNDDITKNVGFSEEVELRKQGRCPFCKMLVVRTDFRDELSKTEFEMAGICQTCQDKTFTRRCEEPKDELTVGAAFGISDERYNELMAAMQKALDGEEYQDGILNLTAMADEDGWFTNETLWAGFMLSFIIGKSQMENLHASKTGKN